jgi:translation initiation factor RLI1
VFSGVPGVNKNYQITQDSSPLDIFEICFSTDLFFYEKVAEGLLTSAGTEPQVQGQTSSPAGRLIGRDHFLYGIPVTHAKLKGKSQRSCRVRAERSKRQTRTTKKMHYNVLSKM